MSSSIGPPPQEEESTVTLYDLKMAAPMGCFAYKGEFSSVSAPAPRHGPPKPTPIVLMTPCATCLSQQVEKAKFWDSPMDDSEVEILEESPAALPTVTTPRPAQRPKTTIQLGHNISTDSPSQLPGPQAIHPVGSPDPPLSLERLESLKDVLSSKTVCRLFNFLLYLYLNICSSD